MSVNRIYWYDNLKAIAIFLVIFGHFVDNHMMQNYVYSFHMELFFFISGIFHSSRYSFKQTSINKFKTLLIPYFIFSGLNFILIILRRQYGNTPDLSYTLQEKFIAILTWNQFWFLGVLYVVVLLFYFIAPRLDSTRKLLIFAAIASLIHYIMKAHFDPWLHENLPKVFTAIIFYALGFFLRDWLKDQQALDKFFGNIGIMLIILVINLTAFYLAYDPNKFININYYHNYLYFYTMAISGILLACFVARHIRENVYFNFIGANTILIYLMEGYPPAITTRLMYYLFEVDNFADASVSYALLYSMITLIILTPFIIIINRYLPFMAGRFNKPAMQSTT